MWTELGIWRVQDGQFPELAVGDVWEARLEVETGDAEEAATKTAPGIELIDGPLTAPGPRYELVGRVEEDSLIGTFLDVGTFPVAPLGLTNWQPGAYIRLRSELYGSECLFSEPPDPLIRPWRVRQLAIRYARALPDIDPDSWRPSRSDVRFRAIERMSMWADSSNPFADAPRIADYVIEVEAGT